MNARRPWWKTMLGLAFTAFITREPALQELPVDVTLLPATGGLLATVSVNR